MKIQFNTDKSIQIDERRNDFFCKQITEVIKSQAAHITRIEVHISDQNGSKNGLNDKRCSMEARLEGRSPLAITANVDTVEHDESYATEKLKSSLETIIGHIKNSL